MIEIIPNWHPVFVHFTVALLLISAVFYLVSFLADDGRGTLLLQASRLNLFTGVITALATVVAGFYAYNGVQHDAPSHAAMTDHRNWALATAALWGLVGVWEGWRAWRRQGRSLLVAVVLVVAAGMLSVTGFKGGELVFRHGLGVQSLPNADDHEHSGGASQPHGHEGASDDQARDSGHRHTEQDHHSTHEDAAAPLQPTGELPGGEVNARTELSGSHVHPDGSSHTH